MISTPYGFVTRADEVSIRMVNIGLVITYNQTHYEDDQDKIMEPRRSTRQKTTIKRLQVDGYSKKYRESDDGEEDDLDGEDEH